MANSKYEYVKSYEQLDYLLPSTYIVVRIDGRGFHRFSDRYGFKKPNDIRALKLMNASAAAVLKDLADINVAYGVSDEFSFVFDKSTTLFERRASKILTTVVSTFTASYVSLWPSFFPDMPLSTLLPTFDGRVVLYPNDQVLRDYLSWRQVDCHINNLYNTTFWAMVHSGISQTQAEEELKGTLSSDKNEILFSRYGINYNNEDEIFKKGSVVYRSYDTDESGEARSAPEGESESGIPISKSKKEKERKKRQKAQISTEHVDIIKDLFWENKPWPLSGKS